MKSLLIINSSGRITRSVTRQLTGRFEEKWLSANPDGEVIDRDVGTFPPSPVSEAWIAAAYSSGDTRTSEMAAALSESETLIREIERADAIVMGVPMYNFGMPSQLMAYFGQIVRVGRTFDFNADPTNPYRPLLQSKPVIVITSTGDAGYEPGGANAALNFLEPHLLAVLSLLGLTEVQLIRVAFQGSHDERFRASLNAAEEAVDAAVGKLAAAGLESAGVG